MKHRILEKGRYVEVHVSGPTSKWDIMKLIFELQRQDPNKQRKGLWLLDEQVEFELHAFPLIIKGILNLVVRNTLKKGEKTAILAANEQQLEKAHAFCTKASGNLPYPVRAFTSRPDAMNWLER